MRVTTTTDGVSLVGRLDANAAGPVRDALHAALSARSGRLVVDLAGVELLDVTGLGVLVGAHRRARLEGRELVLRAPRPRVRRLLKVTRLDRVITIEAPIPAAQPVLI
jgi:anti-sigma B factor antagonist